MRIDEAVFRLINSDWTHPVLDYWSAFVGATVPNSAPGAIVLAAILGLIVWRAGRRGRAVLALLLLSAAISDGVVVKWTKRLTARQRPWAVLTGVRQPSFAYVEPRILALGMPLVVPIGELVENPGPGRAFPSGHTANAFLAAGILSLAYRKRGWLALLPAGGVAYARVYSGTHWPSDVLAGAVIGLLLAVAAVKGYERSRMRLALQGRSRWWGRLPSVVPATDPPTE